MMYVSNLNSADASLLPQNEAMEKILAFLKKREYKKIVEGTDYPIIGKELFARIQHYQTMDEKDCPAEKHEVYVDVVYMVSGTERIGWCQVSPAVQVTAKYDKEKDVAFYDRLFPVNYITVDAGALFIIPTSDVHRPCVKCGDKAVAVEKVVFKVKQELLR